MLETERAEKEQLISELRLVREQTDINNKKRTSIDPWVEVIGESVDPVKGIEIKLDWNDAFIQYLKENGITAKDDDTAVQKWLAFLYQDLIEKFEQKIINNSDIITDSEYI
ncbi:MAG: hypothetical protein ACXW2E_00840 [Nitrososphaeraceae archaeon]